MKLHFGAIPENAKFRPEERGWRPIPHDSPKHTLALALPVAIILFCALRAMAELLDFDGPGEMAGGLLIFALLILPSIVVHELLHAAVHPGHGLSRRSILGFWPRHRVFFAHYEGRMSRNRFLVLFLLPISVLTVPPLVACAALGFKPAWVAFVVALNGVFGSGDVIGAVRVFRYIPPNAIVRNKGWYTWWKADAETMARVPIPPPEVKQEGLGRLVPIAKWAAAIVLFWAAAAFIFDPFLGGHSHARYDLSAPTRVFEPGNGYQPVGAITENDVVGLWRGAPDWRGIRPELSREIWRAGYRFQIWKRGMTVVLVDDEPEAVGRLSKMEEFLDIDADTAGDASDEEECDCKEHRAVGQ